jgi:hypothetical protein
MRMQGQGNTKQLRGSKHKTGPCATRALRAAPPVEYGLHKKGKMGTALARPETGRSLPDLGPVLGPLGFCFLPVSCSGAPEPAFSERMSLFLFELRTTWGHLAIFALELKPKREAVAFLFAARRAFFNERLSAGARWQSQ